ncbi:MAG TPA: hypothetical protein VFH47_07995 [Candidatus Thermoplasmatota archaeon]|nr:hypothetical protein [Candidatus Thermoplasmatota archaeon]
MRRHRRTHDLLSLLAGRALLTLAGCASTPVGPASHVGEGAD